MRRFFLVASFFIATNLMAQETSVLLKEAYNLELKYNEQDALAKYKQVLVNEPNNYKALTRATELSCNIGTRTTNAKDKRLMYESALAFANRAFITDSTNANSLYLISLASGKMTEVETENKKRIAYVRDTKLFADKALVINANSAMANFIEGKWHYEMITLSWAKKVAVKTLYGGLFQEVFEIIFLFLLEN